MYIGKFNFDEERLYCIANTDVKIQNDEPRPKFEIVGNSESKSTKKAKASDDVGSVIYTITALLSFLVVGEVTANLSGIPISGGVVGFVFFLMYLIYRGSVPDEIDNIVPTLLRHLSLLFVPAGVGILEYFNKLSTEWIGLAAAIAGSTMLTIAVTSAVFVVASQKFQKDDGICGADK